MTLNPIRARNPILSSLSGALAAATLTASLTGCGLLIGNVKPVDEKSESYGVTDLSRDRPDTWTKLVGGEAGADAKDPETTATEVSDVAFQAKASPSIIALNSACRPGAGAQEKSLRDLTHELLLGFSEVTQRVERNLTVQSTPALETTLQGRLNGRAITMRTVVLRRDLCVYDLLYMAPPAKFAQNEPDFEKFVASLRLR